jgi:hypothetical protein
MVECGLEAYLLGSWVAGVAYPLQYAQKAGYGVGCALLWIFVRVNLWADREGCGVFDVIDLDEVGGVAF